MDYIEKLLLLERAVGAKIGYQLFVPPTRFNPRDPVMLSQMARDIGHFVGVKDPLVVAATAHEQSCAGHIDLGDTSTGVFIEVADDLLDFPACVLATLAHEVSHRYLNVHRVACGNGPEFHYHNEILTDIAAVFLGLGTLMLNGCTAERIYEQTTNGSRQVVTKKRTVSYLEPEQLTFVYVTVCSMRGIPPQEYEQWLVATAIDRLRECHRKYAGQFFSADFRSDTICSELQERVDRAIADCTSSVNQLEGELHRLQYGYLSKIAGLLANARDLAEALKRPSIPDISYDRALNFLLAIKMSVHTSRAIHELRTRVEDAKHHTKVLSNVLAIVNEKSPVQSASSDSLKTKFGRLFTKTKK